MFNVRSTAAGSCYTAPRNNRRIAGAYTPYTLLLLVDFNAEIFA